MEVCASCRNSAQFMCVLKESMVYHLPSTVPGTQIFGEKIGEGIRGRGSGACSQLEGIPEYILSGDFLHGVY